MARQLPIQAAYLADLRRSGGHPDGVLAGLAAALADRLDLAPAAVAGRFPAAAEPVPWVPDELVSPDLLGAAHEALISADERRSRGAHYTPRSVADGLVSVALPATEAPPVVCDPSLGGGAFLLAAGRALTKRGLSRDRVVREVLFGSDIDPVAVAVADASLALWSGEEGPMSWAGDHLRAGDAVALEPEQWWGEASFDLVIGNPPFSTPLDALGRSPGATEAARRRLLTEIGPYTDEAGLFLLVALRLARVGGRVALLQPESFVAARDAAPVRARVHDQGALIGLWSADDDVFDADVRVCAPVVEVGGVPPRSVSRWVGGEFTVAAPAPPVEGEGPWSSLIADLRGVPVVDVQTGGTLGDLCTVSAGFRDEYYGLRDAVNEARAEMPPPGPLLVTAGLIDPAVCHWGRRPCRFTRRSWQRPWVDLDRLSPRIRRWVEERLVPKVVLAPQTAVVEAAVDETGTWVPSTPLVSLRAAPDRLWHIAALLAAPPISALAHRRAAGAGLSSSVLRLAVDQVAALPQPADHAAWQDGAHALRRAAGAPDEEAWRARLVEAGRTMTRAYGVDPAHPVVDWWAGHLPAWRRPQAPADAASLPSGA